VMQLYSQENSPLTNLAYSYMGQMYIALPIGLMSMYYTLNDGKALLLLMFIMIWLNDTGAFLVGSMIGRHRLFPRISPKKSWEGFVGGVAFAIISGIIAKLWLPDYFESASFVSLCGMGFIVGIFATWGDLVESLIKRTLGVKDSGNILPGHGGILDRIDSLLLVVPATLLYLIAITLYI
ncbi:MAG: phosphatidate cytidylyltransferase, partial [Duncaniella sp.]|nr:phosphatidate cytidylyltransferase [Duncaniella sp.]